MEAGSAAAPVNGVVGPNAVIQLAGALRDAAGLDRTRDLFDAAGLLGLLAAPPRKMVDEAVARALFDELWQAFPAGQAWEIASEAGRRTADYVIANRIPRLARWVFALLPKRPACRLLLRAIDRNAWTFVGSGTCTVRFGQTPSIEIENNPLAMPDCAWHCAVFERMFRRLVSADARVDHANSRRGNAEVCLFTIHL